MIDQPMLLYIATGLLSFYGFGLFVWWWLKMGKASYMFKYLTILFLGTGIRNTIDMSVRYLKLTGDIEAYMVCFDTWWWTVRLYIPFLVVGCIVGHISYRAFLLRDKVVE